MIEATMAMTVVVRWCGDDDCDDDDDDDGDGY